MPYTCYRGKDIKSIIQVLPDEQILHMSHVSILVSRLTKMLIEDVLYIESAYIPEYKYFGRAAFYHDIGKALIPQKLLEKPGKLSNEEYLIIQKHTLYAKEVFSMISSNMISGMPVRLIPLALDSAVYHHEWWNGKGYPFGIAHENIPLIARITSICDAYDAITSNRAYRKARAHCDACRELDANAGTQFDPLLAKVFLDNEQEIKSLCKWLSIAEYGSNEY